MIAPGSGTPDASGRGMELALRINRAIVAVENASDAVAVAAMFFVMVVVTLDATLRYAVGAPLQWSYDVVSLYALVLIGYLPMSGTLRDGAHVSVSLFVGLLPTRALLLIRILVTAMVLCLLAFFFVLSIGATLKSYSNGEVRMGVVLFLVWPSYLPIALGFCVILARVVFSFLLLVLRGNDPFIVQDGEVLE